MRAASFLRPFLLAFLLGPLLAACTPVALLVSATGVATDTSVTWEVVKHIHGQLTENDATPCIELNSVQRALNARCEYRPGSIRTVDIARSGLQECPLAVATRDPRLWRALPELLDKGAQVQACPDRRCWPWRRRMPAPISAPHRRRCWTRSAASPRTTRAPSATTSFACCPARAPARSASTGCS